MKTKMATKKATKSKKKAVKKKDPNSALKKLIVQRFLNPHKIMWPRDMKIAQYLIGIYPDWEFWKSFTLDYELNSLAFLRGEQGLSILEEKHKLYKKHKIKPKKKKVKLSEDKYGDDYEKETKPKNLKDFLNE